MSLRRNSEIDYLRAYAVMLVVALHLALIAHDHLLGRVAEFQAIVDLGTGVDIFFVISGYVVYGAYQRLRAQGLEGNRLYTTFLLRRFIRLWPASTFWLFYCLAGSVLFMGQGLWPSPIEAARGLLAGLAYVFNFEQYNNRQITGYFWSLSVEWQFYVIFPFLASKLDRGARLAVLACMIGIGAVWRPGGLDWWMFRFDGLLFGLVLYEVVDHPSVVDLSKRLRRMINGSVILRAALTAALILEVTYSAKYIRVEYLSNVVSCAFAFLLVLLAARGEGLTFAALPKPVLLWVGLRSYSIYLCHVPMALTLLGICKTLNYQIGPLVFASTTVVATAIACELSYRFLEEKPQQRASRSIPLGDAPATTF